MRASKILIFLFFLFFAQLSFAQLNMGLRAGMTAARWQSQERPRYAKDENRKGFYVSIPAELVLGRMLSVVAEASYTEQGNISRPAAPGPAVNTRLQCLNLPLLVKFSPTATAAWYLNAGIGGSYAMAGKIRLENGDDRPAQEFGLDFSEAGLNRFDCAVLMGGGLRFFTGSGSLTLDFRYAMGLTDLSTAPDVIRNSRVMSFGLGYCRAISPKMQRKAH